jgi:hypothetical protein
VFALEEVILDDDVIRICEHFASPLEPNPMLTLLRFAFARISICESQIWITTNVVARQEPGGDGTEGRPGTPSRDPAYPSL